MSLAAAVLELEVLIIFLKAERASLSETEIMNRLQERGVRPTALKLSATLLALAGYGMVAKGEQHRYPTLALTAAGKDELLHAS
jgi:hypothetical protein